MKADKGHYAFIPGRSLGFLEAREQRRGAPRFLRLNGDDDITATLDDSGVDFQLPSFLYAVEEDFHFDPIKKFIPGGTGRPRYPLRLD